MIAKTAERRKDCNQKHSYHDLVSYIAGGGKAEKTLYTNYRNISVIAGKNETEEIIKEMNACAEENLRAKSKVQHGILSWREGEIPTKEQIDEAVSIYLEEMGMENCQCFYGIHQNTQNMHVHICVNKIDPQTHLTVTPANGWDKKANERIARRIELTQGWEVLKRGEHYEVIDGKIYEKRTKKEVPNLGTKAKDYENLTSGKSAERKAQERCAKILFNAANWETVHKELAAVGCRIEKKGSGAVLFVGEQQVKLSKVSQKLSLKKMENRLGTFKEPQTQYYIAEVKDEPLRKTKNSRTYLQERKKYYEEKDEAKKALRETFTREAKELKERQKKERQELYEALPSWKGKGVLLNAMRSELAWRQLNEREAWQVEKKKRTKQLYAAFGRFPSYKDWLIAHDKKQEAEIWRYRETIPGVLIAPDEETLGRNSAILSGRYKTERVERGNRKGVVYRRETQDGQISFVDSGRRIVVVDWQNEQTIQNALELANQKWGGATINGSKEYIDRCVEIAARTGLRIANPELQDRISELRKTIMKTENIKQEHMDRVKEIRENLEKYTAAVGADRYRITAFYTGKDGKPKAYVFDKDRYSSMPSQGYTKDELMKQAYRIYLADNEKKNIYITPISEKTNHILVDDLTAKNLKQIANDGFRPVILIESSNGNYQAVFNVPKTEKYQKETANSTMRALNQLYGDKNILGAVHPHRIAGTHNHKPKRTLPDGSQPKVKMIFAATRPMMCDKTAKVQEEYRRRLERSERERQKRIEEARRRNAAESRNITPYEAYMTHAADIINYRGESAKSNMSVVDSMIAVRMYVTGWSVSEIQDAIETGAKDIRSESDKNKHNWKDYARRTAAYVESYSGSREVAANRNKERMWKRLEGRIEEYKQQYKRKERDLER